MTNLETDATASGAEAPLADLYRRYVASLNAYQFERLDTFVHSDVRINGEQGGLAAYRQGLAEVVVAFPDYHWRLDHLLVSGNWLAAKFTDSGTHLGTFLGVPPSGKTVRTFELAHYRFDHNKITEVWGTGFAQQLLEQVREP